MTMTQKKIIAISCAIGVACVSATPVSAIPVVPNFTQGSMTSVTTTTSTVNETINSMDYATGWTYSVSGHGVETDANSIVPDSTSTQSQNVNTVNSTWTGLDLSSQNKPNWRQSQAGGNFSLIEHYSGPGLQTHTIIQRETTVQSVTESTSIFSN